MHVDLLTAHDMGCGHRVPPNTVLKHVLCVFQRPWSRSSLRKNEDANHAIGL
jgi:hypothetical protein